MHVDLSRRDEKGFVAKSPLVDLLDIHDPGDLDDNGFTVFSFPFFTIESVLLLDARTILVANDNNYPTSRGRPPEIDANEFILIELPEPLRWVPPSLPPVAAPTVAMGAESSPTAWWGASVAGGLVIGGGAWIARRRARRRPRRRRRSSHPSSRESTRDGSASA
jgi:hypothetical protein